MRVDVDDDELRQAFDQVRRLGSLIRPRSNYDSIVITCCTQFQFAHHCERLKGVVSICERLIEHLVTDTPEKEALAAAIVKLRTLIDRS